MNQKHINLLQKTWKRIYRAIVERKPLRGLCVGIFSLPSGGWLAGSFDLHLPWPQSSRKFSWADKQYIPHFLHFHLFIIFMSQWIIESDILIAREARHTDERNAVRGDSCALFKTFNIWINPLSLFCFLASSKCCFSSSNRSFPKTKGSWKGKYLPAKPAAQPARSPLEPSVPSLLTKIPPVWPCPPPTGCLHPQHPARNPWVVILACTALNSVNSIAKAEELYAPNPAGLP